MMYLRENKSSNHSWLFNPITLPHKKLVSNILRGCPVSGWTLIGSSQQSLIAYTWLQFSKQSYGITGLGDEGSFQMTATESTPTQASVVTPNSI